MTLESFGLLWDKKVMYQSNQIDFYVQYLEILKKKKKLTFAPVAVKISSEIVGLEG